MSSKKKQKRDDDELFPDTPARKPEKAKSPKTEKREKAEVEKPTKDRKAEKAEPAAKKVAREEKPRDEKPREDKARDERESQEREEKPRKRVEEAAPPPRTAAAGPAQPPVASTGAARKLALGMVALVAAGGVGVFLVTQMGDTHPTPRPSNVPSLAPTRVAILTKSPAPLQPLAPKPLPSGMKLTALPSPAPGDEETIEPVKPAAKPSPREGHAAAELANRSANHAAIARTLEAFDAVRKVVLGTDDRLFDNYKEKQKREAELIDQIRGLGPGAIAAMKDMIMDLDDPGYRLLVTKALAGMKDPEAMRAAADILANVHDTALDTTLVRWLPDGLDSNALIAKAFSDEQNPNVRSMLLREYATRLGEPNLQNPNATAPMDPAARQLLSQAAQTDPDPSVRAEAVQIIGRRGDPQDMALMAQIAQSDPNLQIRQSAIVAYALTGQSQSLGTLSQLATSPDSQVEIRASAVLAIARVGGDAKARDQALQTLDQIAQSDPSDQIRARAQHFAQALRANANQPSRPPVSTQPIPFAPHR